MSRVAIVRDSDIAVRRPDDISDDTGELRDVIVAAGHEVVVCDADVMVVALTAGGRGLAECVPIELPCIAVIARTADRSMFDEEDRSSIETFADAYVRGTRALTHAVAWVIAEDRSARSQGQPRLTVIGSTRDDFGMSRALVAEPMTIGRASSFGQHPQRPDRLPTPVGNIARHHARARFIDGVTSVNDMRSTNGTLVIRRGERARLLCPQQAHSGREFGPPETAWLIRDPTSEWTALGIGDHLQLPGFWRFRLDGDPSWRPEE